MELFRGPVPEPPSAQDEQPDEPLGRGAPRQRRAPDRYVAAVMEDAQMKLRRFVQLRAEAPARACSVFCADACGVLIARTAHTQPESCACKRGSSAGGGYVVLRPPVHDR